VTKNESQRKSKKLLTNARKRIKMIIKKVKESQSQTAIAAGVNQL